MIQLDIQNACKTKLPVSDEQLRGFVKAALASHQKNTELTIRFVEIDEITHLNHTYRKKNNPTNVLAFPSNLPDEILSIHPLLGDVIICPYVPEKESRALNIPPIAHWAHIVIHGVLHLLGYDHIDSKDAAVMEAHEIKALQNLGYNNPYETEDNPLD